jgi:hypothetical protein
VKNNPVVVLKRSLHTGRFVIAVTCLCLGASLAGRPVCGGELREHGFELVNLSPNGPLYGVFSVGQHVVSNRNGIFLTYLSQVQGDEAGPARYANYTWNLVQIDPSSSDAKIIYSTTEPARSPLVETDSADNLYLIYPIFRADEQDGKIKYEYKSRFMRFAAASGYKLAVDKWIQAMPISEAKYAAYYDQRRNVIYYSGCSLEENILVLDLQGDVVLERKVVQDGSRGYFQYPRFTMDKSGSVYLAWTNGTMSANPNANVIGRLSRGFPSIHYLVSSDGARHWRSIGSAPGSTPTTPVSADDVGDNTGNLVQAGDEQFKVSTTPYRPGNFLSDFTFSRGHLYFAYLSEGIPSPLGVEGVDFLRARSSGIVQRQHFIEIDANNGRRTVDIKPKIQAADWDIEYPEGAMSRDPRTGDIYYVSVDVDKDLVAVRAQAKSGGFTQVAKADLVVNHAFRLPINHIATARNVTDEGDIVGTFMLQTGEPSAPQHALYFFKVKVR